MNAQKLDNFLRKTTSAEEWHRKHPEKLSKTYSRIEQTVLNRKTLYIFRFDSIIHNGKFAIQKESRYTGVPSHRHTTIEMNYVYSGEAHYIINDQAITLHQGEFCILDTNVVHKLELMHSDDIIMNIEMRPEYFSTSFFTQLANEGVVADFLIDAISEQKKRENYLLFHAGSNEKLQITMREILCEYFEPTLCSEQIIQAYMLVVFSLLIRTYQASPHKENEKNLKDDILSMLEYIEANYRHLTLNDLGKEFGYHPNYISAVLKSNLNKNFRQLKLEIQMKQATILMKSSDLPIYEIATEIGFTNIGQFYRKFELYTGIRPSEFRKGFRENS